MELRSQILKIDAENREVWGWASVVTKNGEPVTDLHGDRISPEELVKAATEFMTDLRVAKAMHQGTKIGEVVHSFPLTYELAKSLGIETPWEGWIVSVKIHDDSVWSRVKAGELKAFSFGGEAIREPV